MRLITARAQKDAVTAKQYFGEHFSQSDCCSEGRRSLLQRFGKGVDRLGISPISEVAQEAFNRLGDNLHSVTGEAMTSRRRQKDRRVFYGLTAPPTVSNREDPGAEFPGEASMASMSESPGRKSAALCNKATTQEHSRRMSSASAGFPGLSGAVRPPDRAKPTQATAPSDSVCLTASASWVSWTTLPRMKSAAFWAAEAARSRTMGSLRNTWAQPAM